MTHVYTYQSHDSSICRFEGVLFEATEVATEQDPLPSSHEVCHKIQQSKHAHVKQYLHDCMCTHVTSCLIPLPFP